MSSDMTPEQQQAMLRDLRFLVEHHRIQMAMAEHGENNPIRATLFTGLALNEDTLEALNALASKVGEASFVVENNDNSNGESRMFMEHPNAKAGKDWCNKMNCDVFPPDIGVGVGYETDTAVAVLGMVYRFPIQFYHFVAYVRDGQIYYDTAAQDWDCVDTKKKVGHYEEGYGREQFQDWMQRQVARLNDYGNSN